MLNLTRKKQESLLICEEADVTVLSVKDNQMSFAVNVPFSVTVYRKDIIKNFSTREREQYGFYIKPESSDESTDGKEPKSISKEPLMKLSLIA